MICARSRWRPTGEQKHILERLFEGGIRKPSADQIQQIIVRLRALGPIEAKNVSYWFHNFKAKLRHKLKQVQEKGKHQSSVLIIASHDVTTTTTLNDSNTKQCMNTRSLTSTSASMSATSSLNIQRNENDGKILSADEGLRYEYVCRPEYSRHVVINDENAAIVGNNSFENSETLVLFPLTPTSEIIAKKKVTMGITTKEMVDLAVNPSMTSSL